MATSPNVRLMTRTILIAIVLLLPAGVTARAQSELRGRVVSVTGAPIPGATVTLTSIGYSVRTDSLGVFRLAGTPGSTLGLSFKAEGFRDDTASVVLARGRAVVRDFRLEADDQPPEAPAATGRFLRGTVSDTDGAPLAWANVQVNGGRAYVSDDSGRFAVPVPFTGRLTVLARRIGFEPMEVKLDGIPDSALRLSLTSIPTALPEMRVTGRSPFVRLDVGGFYRRLQDVERGINRGYFITPEELEIRKPFLVTSAVEHLPNIMIRPSPSAVARIGIPLNRLLRFEDARRCALTVYLDRVRVSPTFSSGVWVDEEINTMVQPTAVAGIEVYPRVAGAPPDFALAPGTCGLVLIWTR